MLSVFQETTSGFWGVSPAADSRSGNDTTQQNQQAAADARFRLARNPMSRVCKR